MIAFFAGVQPALAANEVNVYSGRQEALIKPLLDDFTERTGIKVNLVTGSADALISRLQSEGDLSPADIIILADAGRLVRANSLGLLQKVDSASLLNTIPADFRADNNHWVGLTKRARVVMYKKGEFDPSQIATYADLTKPEYKGEICIRSSSNIYNQSMVAAQMLIEGEAQTLAWAQGIKNNFARTPKGGDRDQIRAMVAGECKLAVANTYYLGGMIEAQDPATQDIAKQVGVIWPNQETSGTHIQRE